MNKPVEIHPVRTLTPAPLALVPTPQPAPPVASRFRKSWLIGSLSSLAAIAAVGVVWWLSSASGTVQYTTAAVTRGAIIRAADACAAAADTRAADIISNNGDVCLL